MTSAISNTFNNNRNIIITHNNLIDAEWNVRVSSRNGTDANRS